MLWRTRDVEAPAGLVWDLLVDLDRWPEWGPSVRRAERDDGARRLGPDARGHVHPLLGPPLPFRVDGWEDGHLWSWRVAGLRATSHRVDEIGPARCRVGMAAPAWAPAYLPVLDLALRRIERLVPSSG